MGAAVVLLGAARPPRSDEPELKITVNGQPMEVADDLTVEGLLATLGVRREFTAVAVNAEVTPRAAHATTRLKDGDRVEIVRPMGGG